jgi:hypothetical protein
LPGLIGFSLVLGVILFGAFARVLLLPALCYVRTGAPHACALTGDADSRAGCDISIVGLQMARSMQDAPYPLARIEAFE